VVKVKALYHFLDRKACRNRMLGDVFDATENIAEEMAEAGLVEILEPKAKPKTTQDENPADAEPDKGQNEVQEKPKKRRK